MCMFFSYTVPRLLCKFSYVYHAHGTLLQYATTALTKKRDDKSLDLKWTRQLDPSNPVPAVL